MILTPLGVPFHPVVVICLGKNILLKSVLGHCVPVHLFGFILLLVVKKIYHTGMLLLGTILIFENLEYVM